MTFKAKLFSYVSTIIILIAVVYISVLMLYKYQFSNRDLMYVIIVYGVIRFFFGYFNTFLNKLKCHPYIIQIIQSISAILLFVIVALLSKMLIDGEFKLIVSNYDSFYMALIATFLIATIHKMIVIIYELIHTKNT